MNMFDRFTDDNLITIAKRHTEKFNEAWRVVMTNHYKTGRYIDAHERMEREYKAIGEIRDYIYNHRPHTLFDRFVAEINHQ